MNNQSKGFSILSFLIWPFSALLIGFHNFDSLFGKRLVIALYAFLGFTAYSVGDLERYESQFYDNITTDLWQIILNLTSLQTSKFYNDFISVGSSLFFESHHYYFLILFLIFGHLYITTIHNLKDVNLQNLNKFGLMFFWGLLLIFLVRPLFGLAFSTGGFFIIYHTVLFYKNNRIKNLLFILLAPLFHIGLSIYLIVPALLLLFKNRTLLYILFVLVTFAVGQSKIVGAIETIANANSGSIIEEKYKTYADEKGRKHLDERYTEGLANYNIKARTLVAIQNSIWYIFVPLGLVLVYLKSSLLLTNQKIFRLFHIVLLFWGVSNLMINISQGDRFVELFSFMAIGLFFAVYITSKDLSKNTIFSKFLHVFIPILFTYGIMVTYSTNNMFSAPFFISNFFIEIFSLMTYKTF